MPVLAVGDFNEGEDGSAMRWLGKKGLTNALPLYDRRTPTWHWKTGWLQLKRRMDFVLFSKELDCYHAKVIPAGASDHYPVVATIGKR